MRQQIKEFQKWIIYKGVLDTKIEKGFAKFSTRDIYWCAVGENIGDEENGKGEQFHRPVLVVRKFNRYIFLGIPLSTKIKENPYYIPIFFHNEQRSALISQMRIFDVRRLADKIGRLNNTDFDIVKKSIQKLFI